MHRALDDGVATPIRIRPAITGLSDRDAITFYESDEEGDGSMELRFSHAYRSGRPMGRGDLTLPRVGGETIRMKIGHASYYFHNGNITDWALRDVPLWSLALTFDLREHSALHSSFGVPMSSESSSSVILVILEHMNQTNRESAARRVNTCFPTCAGAPADSDTAGNPVLLAISRLAETDQLTVNHDMRDTTPGAKKLAAKYE